MRLSIVVALAFSLLAASAEARHLTQPPWGPPPGSPTPVSPLASDWQFLSEGPTATLEYWVHPFNDANGYLRIMFPPWTSSLNMLYTVPFYATTGFRFLHALLTVITTSGSPTLIPDDPCPGPARARLFLYSASNRGTEWERFYGIAAPVTLVPSSATWPPVPTLTADLMDLAAWVSAAGTSATINPAAFADAKASAQLGVVFGGQCFAGHGVGVVSGGADFILQGLWAE